MPYVLYAAALLVALLGVLRVLVSTRPTFDRVDVVAFVISLALVLTGAVVSYFSLSL